MARCERLLLRINSVAICDAAAMKVVMEFRVLAPTPPEAGHASRGGSGVTPSGVTWPGRATSAAAGAG
jgi:hypothetical protein